MNDELQEKTWELLLELASEAERFGLDSGKITPHHTRLLQLIKHDRKINGAVIRDDQVRRMLSNAKDELGHEKTYTNNQANIEYYTHVIDFLSKRHELVQLTTNSEVNRE